MIREPFAHGDSWMHRIDPRFRVAGALLFAVAVALSRDTVALVAALALSLASVLAARLNRGQVLRGLMAPAMFLLLIWAVIPWTHGGVTWFHAGPVAVSRPGIDLCIQISLKTTTLLLTLMALISTMTLDTLGNALSRLGVPDKMVYMMLITYRYLFLLEQEYQRLTRAMKVRGFRPGTNLHTYRSYAYLLGMLFVRASERARRVHWALVCRGFSGRFASLREYPGNGRRRAFSVCVVFSVMIVCLLSLVGGS
jgi:cobalt/nickel transport system permease protein